MAADRLIEMTCRELTERITDYLEGALSADDHTRFDDHVAVCPYCAAYLDQMKLTIALLGKLNTPDRPTAAAPD